MTKLEMQNAAEAAAKEVVNYDNPTNSPWPMEQLSRAVKILARHFATLCEDEPITPSEVSQAVRSSCAAKDVEIARLTKERDEARSEISNIDFLRAALDRMSKLAENAEKVVEAAEDVCEFERLRTGERSEPALECRVSALRTALAEYAKNRDTP